MRNFNSRINPRPVAAFETVTAAAPSARTKVACGTTKVGRIYGGTISRITGGNGTGVSVDLTVYRASATAVGDFIERETITLAASGPEAGQGSFAFNPPLEFNSSGGGFWITLQNAASTDEDYQVSFDVEPCVDVKV